MLTLESLLLRYSSKVIFGGVSASISARDRIALVGSNGMGKSTLLKVLIGEVALDGGKIHRPNYLSMGYLPQDGIVIRGKTLFKEVESAFEDILSIQGKIEVANEQLQALAVDDPEYTELLEIIGDWEHRLEELDAYQLKSKVEKVLLGLGFSLDDMERDTGEFSGGWQMRIALAKLLLREPSLLLLDEPTNHLDLTSQRWVEGYLRRYEGALVIISHDRSFLDELCNRTFRVSMGNMEVYEGNYSFYERESVLRKELAEKAYASQQRQLKHTQQFINRFRAKASKARQVQSRVKAMEKVERIELEEEESGIQFSFPKATSSGQVVLELEKVRKAYGALEVFRDLDLRIEKGDRIAVVGVNGAGKSTLAKVLAGVEPCSEGERKVGYNVELSYFAQQQADALDPTKTPLDIAEEAAKLETKRQARSILGAFLFRADDVFKRVKVLSGGERCRLALACIVLQQSNCLILDEPTNHLDMRSQEMLQNALKRYTGTLFIISHNRGFLDPLVTKVLEVSKTGIRIFLGNVSEYLEEMEAEDIRTVEAQDVRKKVQKSEKKISSKERRRQEAERRKALNPLKKKAELLEKRIAELEASKAEMETTMANPEFFKRGEETRTGMERHKKLELELEQAFEEWGAVVERIKAHNG